MLGKKTFVRAAALLAAAFIALGGLHDVAARAEAQDEAALLERYEAAKALYEAGEFGEAYEAFDALDGYADSRARARASKREWTDKLYFEAIELHKAEKYYEAREIYRMLGSYKKSRANLYECEVKILRAEYAEAKALQEAGELEAAQEMFESFGSYHDSRERVRSIQEAIDARDKAALELRYYERAMELKANGDLEGARDAFIESGDCKDATEQLNEIIDGFKREKVYEAAKLEYKNGGYESAYGVFAELGDYSDSAEMTELCLNAMLSEAYAHAAASEKPESAYIIYLSLGDYENSAELAEGLRASFDDKALYAAADAFYDAGEYGLASVGFKAATGVKKSAERAEKSDANARKLSEYKRALALRRIGEGEQANAILKALGGFNDANKQIMPVGRFTAGQLRDYRTSPMSPVFTAPDGSEHSYRIYKGVQTWVEAKEFCEALGGHLATLTSEEENQFVYGFMRDCGYLTAYFGLSDEERVGNWIWVTGEPFEYSNWHRGEPSRSGKERYGMYFYKHTKGTWNDSHFYEKAEDDPGCSYICEWDH